MEDKMLYTLAAKVVIMVMDQGLTVLEAVTLVVGNMPSGLAAYHYHRVVQVASLELEGAILLTEVV
jgi:hypothetical protein